MSMIPKDEERILEFEFLRATENAALHSSHWMGRGEKESADYAACDAIRGMFDLMDIRGEVVIGEGIKDEAPGLFKGEKVGTWSEGSPSFDIALDPVDGTTNVAKGMPNSISCIAAAIPEEGEDCALQEIPAFYMNKLSYTEAVRQAWIKDPSLPISVDAPISEVIKISAKILGKNIRDITVMVLDRPRNEHIVEEIRSIGSKLRMIADGDITAAMAPSLPSTDVDLYAGIGGSPEGVLSAAGLRCLGGGQQAKIWPADEAEKQQLIASGWGDKLDTIFRSRDLAKGNNIIFSATGISPSPLLKGVHVDGHTAITHSVLMRIRSKTVRFIEAHHDLRTKTIHLRSTHQETRMG
ncbi:MAG: class II fructose-bisphosphatase [Akkermansiaceae bacterium]|nr:class II fructose-bisphosphatase [Akkermansiaceae bacterium]